MSPDNKKKSGTTQRMIDVIERRSEEVKKRKRESIPPPSPANEELAPLPVPAKKKRVKGKSSLSRIEEAQMEFFKLEKEGRFSQHPITPDSRCPTFLTRVPIFIPGHRSTQRDLLDDENSLQFETSWGKGRKFGPPLTTYDEDTLLGIYKLRQKRLIGLPGNFPIPVSDLHKEKGNKDSNVHVIHCMVSDIQGACDCATGGMNNKLRLDSVKRLAATVIEFTSNPSSNFVSRGIDVKLMDISWEEYEENALLYIQLTPIVSAWLDNEYTFIDINIRRNLSETGKALHRFFSSQPKQYKMFTLKLMKTIHYPREYKHFMSNLRSTMNKLIELEWVQSWEITGNGRKEPHLLHFIRT